MSNPDYFEFIKISITVISPFIASYLTYSYAIKGKLKEVSFHKRQELNIILSHLLLVYHHLIKLKDLVSIRNSGDDELIIPKEFIPLFAVKCGFLNHDCFKNLEKSIENLNKYDPITYYELEGIGKRFDYVVEKILIPFIGSKSHSNVGDKLALVNLDKIIVEIVSTINAVSPLIDKETVKRSKQKLFKPGEEHDSLKNEINQWVYELIIDLMPKRERMPTFDEFLKEASNPEVKAVLNSQVKVLMDNEFESLIKMVAENPDLSFEEIEKELGKLNL
ncbi:hypothetical protein KK083_03390 [Fulvivirgaceae bacterium PWU4]|uniref:Uncharacterized protein n=1 Tax=Chryseosolibacter histidini TaxID=2782349 RepID=A0AAP2GMN3_9BACT|nr:hypothetical protein [Chryseosolibacter histidini]MBT1695905.1 hypothetical protein [Chryseosolibacter histidini]